MSQSPLLLCPPYVPGRVYGKDKEENFKLQSRYSMTRMHMRREPSHHRCRHDSWLFSTLGGE